MNAYDLFCGAGGASIGLEQAGLHVVGFERWDVACATHEAAGFPTVQCDLFHHDWSQWPTPDVLWASPPCQPFSSAGHQRGAEDDRDGMPALVRAIDALRPPIIVMENVKGLTFAKHRWYLDAFVATLKLWRYRVDWSVLNAANYGVPQTRERLILIARHDGGPIAWPLETHAKEPGLFGEKPWVTMAQALGWDGVVGFPRKADDKGAATPDGYRERDWHPTDEPSPMVTGKARSWVYRRPATTVSGDPRIWPPGHKINQADIDAGRKGSDRAGSEAIRVTVEQAAILQGFPPGHPFAGSRTAQFQQIGNAVPWQVAHAVVTALLEAPHG